MFKRIVAIVCLMAPVMILPTSAALAQTATSSISGTVVDSAGGAIPGAAVVVTNDAGASFESVTNAEGVFNVPSVAAGRYKVTVTLAGFKTAVVDVNVLPGTPAPIKVTLEVGQITETVNVRSSAELINTQTATVASTLNADQLNRMPTPSRNALNAVTFLSGVNTATTNRESRINGLPESMIQITLDGVNNNDNYNRSTDSFFASVSPRQDAIEAVSVVTASGGVLVGGSGAVSINFQTRSGTNRFSGTVYDYERHPELNSNYKFNELAGLDKNDVKLHQYGGRAGGPIVIPGLFDGRGKAFYMAHYEQLRFPNSATLSRNVLHPRALDGWFRYTAGNQVREVNVLNLAAQFGQSTAVDPTTISVLRRIQAATATAGVNGTVLAQNDPLVNRYIWQAPSRLFEHQPTAKIDYNLTDNHRLSGSFQMIFAEREPDYLNDGEPQFPGAPNSQRYYSRRPLTSIALRSTLTKNMVNELRGGITAKGGISRFGDEVSTGPQTFEDTGGFALNLDQNIGLTDWHQDNSPTSRVAPTYSLENTLTWQKGTHSVTMGGSFLSARVVANAQQVVPGISLGLDQTNDPAELAGMFLGGSAPNATFPGATTGQLDDARNLYALLTGRVISVTGEATLDANTNRYVPFAPESLRGKIDMYSGYIQDTWRWTPTLTLTGGLRWDVQLPFTPSSSIMSAVSMADVCGISGVGSGDKYTRCNFTAQGVQPGSKIPEFNQLTAGTRGYKTDWNNFAPSAQVAWRPNVQSGFMRALLGDPEQATLRAGYSAGYERQGMDVFLDVYRPNPGSFISLTRNASTGLVGPGEQWPVLLSQRERLHNASFPESPSYPIAVRPNRADDMGAFAPDLKIGVAHTWTVGFQRSITQDMAIEARYVGTYGMNQWSTLDYNSMRGENLLKNGFLDEFKLAMQNLQANNAAGGNRAGSFAYFGPNTGTHPLPIYLAYLNGRRDFTNPGAYTGVGGATSTAATWTSTTFAGRLVPSSPSPVSAAADLDGNLDRRNRAIAAGLPANFFLPNPHLDDVDVTDSGAFSDYHAFQLELRRRLSKGLSANANYQYARERGSAFDGFAFGREMVEQGNVRHAFKTQWDWTIPVGRGQRFGSNLNALLDGILGGWSMNGVGRVQARAINLGNVRLVNMTVDELTDLYKYEIRPNASGVMTVFALPDDIILNTRRAFSTDPRSRTGYNETLGIPEGRYIAPANSANCIQVRAGDCAPRAVIIRTPFFTRFDVGVTKKFPLKGTTNFELRFDVLNVFDNINYNPVDLNDNPQESPTSAELFRVTTAYRDLDNTYDPGGRVGQIMFRFNW